MLVQAFLTERNLNMSLFDWATNWNRLSSKEAREMDGLGERRQPKDTLDR